MAVRDMVENSRYVTYHMKLVDSESEFREPAKVQLPCRARKVQHSSGP